MHKTGCLCAAALLLLCMGNPALLRQIDLKIYDHFLTMSADEKPLGVAAIADVDEASLAAHGQWPWPRYRMARLVRKLLEAGASVVALDILLAEPDRTSMDMVLRDLEREQGVSPRVEGLPDSLRDNDRLLAQILRGNPVVLGSYLLFRGAEDAPQAPRTVLPKGVSVVERSVRDAAPPDSRLLAGDGMVTPLPELTEAASVAFFNAVLDQDGLVRRLPLLAKVEGRHYANLSLRALMLGLGAGSLRLDAGPDGLENIGVGAFSIPVSPEGYMLVPYRGPGRTFPYISAGDILTDNFAPEDVRDRIVFIGASAAGMMDIRGTPLDPYMPGVEVHANMVDAALSGRSILKPTWTPGLQACLIILLSLACLPLFGRARLPVALMGGAALMAGIYAASRHCFGQGIWLTPLWAEATVGIQAIALTAMRFWLSEKDKRRIRNVFSRYVSPEVVARIVDNGEERLRGEQRELSVMFTDLRGFTSLSEKLTPMQVVNLLNRYFTPMTALVRDASGTLDKFIGDSLMAFWNAPLDVPDHPRRAVLTALDMQDALEQLNDELEQNFGQRLAMGAGINTGQAHVGNMGSDDLTSYTALGDTVNLASRLEGLCGRYGVPIVISGETASRLGDGVVLRELARLRVKGRSEPVDVHTVLRPDEAARREDELAAWAEALGLYRRAVAERDMTLLDQASKHFDRMRATWPGPLHTAYAEACAALRREPPEAWTDVWTLTGK